MKVALFVLAAVLAGDPAFAQDRRSTPYVSVDWPVEDFIARLEALPKQQVQGSVSGCITDGSGARLPGVVVDVQGAESHKQVVTGVTGCYTVTDVTPGSYTVRASLTGFCPAEPKDVAVAAGRSSEVNFTLLVAALSGPLWVAMDTDYYWRHADAVVYLRVEWPLGTRRWPAPTCGSIACTEYRTGVLSVVKRHPEAGPDGSVCVFLQDYVASGEPAYQSGEEFVAFLTWNAAWRRFVRSGGPSSLLPVRDGRVVAQSPQDRDVNGMNVEDFIARLRALTK